MWPLNLFKIKQDVKDPNEFRRIITYKNRICYEEKQNKKNSRIYLNRPLGILSAPGLEHIKKLIYLLAIWRKSFNNSFQEEDNLA